MPGFLKHLKWDTIAGRLTLWVIILYTCAYGYLYLNNVAITNLGPGYLIILIPIWLIDGLKSSFEALVPREYKNSKEDLDKVTVIIACKDGEAVIDKTLHSLLRKFRPEQIIVASNGSTDRTCEIVRQRDAVCLDFKEPLGKVRAINAAIPYTKTPYILLLDDDTLIAGATIPTGLLDEGYDAVAFRVLVKISTWITQFQAHEYRKSCDIGRRFHNKGASVQNVSGAIGLFKREVLERQITQHTGEFSGEDLQRTLLIHLASANDRGGVVLARSIVITQAPTTLKDLFNQRTFGWFPGLYANFARMMKIVFDRRAPIALRYDSFHTCVLVSVLDILRVLSLPIVIFYPGYFVIMYIAYFMVEFIPYYRSYRTEPLWVILLFPFYGIFGLLTRACAFTAFLYRRFTVKLMRSNYLDDYRNASFGMKMISTFFASAIILSVLALNLIFNYSALFTRWSWGF